jgi:hypothetical protein
MNNMMNKYYIFDRLELHYWLTESTDFSRTYIKIPRIPGLKSKPVGLNITREKEDRYVTVVSGILKNDNTIFDLHGTNIMQSISKKEYNDKKSKILKCLLEEFKYKNSYSCTYEYGLWWDYIEMYKIPNLIFDTVMQ